jgi:hypothetical protein
MEAFERRVRNARHYIRDFGVASYCGWGREDPSTIAALLANLGASAERLPKIRGA